MALCLHTEAQIPHPVQFAGFFNIALYLLRLKKLLLPGQTHLNNYLQLIA